MRKKTIVTLCGCFIFIFTASVFAFLNPQEVCGCLPDYVEESYAVFDAAQVTFKEALSDGNLHYDNFLLQFAGESMDKFKNKIAWDKINPYNVWFKFEDNTIIALLYKTERTLSYAGIFIKKETIYLLMGPDLEKIFTSRPMGW